VSRLFRLFAALVGSADEVLRVQYPANGWFADAATPSSEGTWQGSLVGSWHEVSATHYLYITQDDGAGRYIGVDPGPYEARLTGMTGVECQLAAGDRTAAQVGADITSSWNLAGTGVTATDNGAGEVDFAGGIDAATIAAAGPGTEWTSRNTEATALGADEYAAPGVAATNVDFLTACQVDPARIPSTTYRVVGIRYAGANLRVAIATGGIVANPEGGTYVYDSGVLAGAAGTDWNEHYFEPSEVFEVGPSELVWMMANGTNGASDIVGGANQDDGWLTTTGNEVYRLGASTGVGTPYTGSVPALSGGNFGWGMKVQMIVQPSPYYGSFYWQSNFIWDRVANPVPASFTNMASIAPTFPCSFPTIPGLDIESLQLYFGAHGAGAQDQMRVELWYDNVGPMSLTDVTDERLFSDLGATSGTDVGWYEMISTPVDIDTVGELRVSVKSASTGAAMTLGFELSGFGNVVGKPGWSLAATTEDGELEYLASAGETWWDFQAGVATGTPLAPNSVPTTPGNAAAIAGRIGVPGFTMTANP